MRLCQSDAWWQRAIRVIPLGTQTLSKGPTQFVQGVSPIYLQRGCGAHVWDVDGNEYVDYPMALGPVILGYAEPDVDEAIRAQLSGGMTFTLMHPLEVEVAERIVAMCPGVEAVRFGKSGSDALSASIRAARALTSRDVVLVSGYHGWHDWYIGTTTWSLGVPAAVQALTKVFPHNDLEALRQALVAHAGDVAAVVLEPCGAEPPKAGYLEGVVELCHEHGAISIFDEVITGFRLAPGGARQRYGVIPDISCYGKALGNGMPISAVGGAWRTMRVFEEIFFSGTHGGEVISLAAARATLDLIATTTVLQRIRHLGRVLGDGMRASIEHYGLQHRVRVAGEPALSVVAFIGPESLVDKTWIQQCFIEAGLLFNGSMFVSGRHTSEDVNRAIDAFAGAISVMAEFDSVEPLLKGPPVKAVFRNP